LCILYPWKHTKVPVCSTTRWDDLHQYVWKVHFTSTRNMCIINLISVLTDLDYYIPVKIIAAQTHWMGGLCVVEEEMVVRNVHIDE